MRGCLEYAPGYRQYARMKHRNRYASRLAGGRRHANNAIKAASDDREKLLDTKLKSIRRGC
jgi:hypothetical protein